MFRASRKLLEVLHSLTDAVQGIADELPTGLGAGGDAGEIRARLEGLELSMATWEANVEGLLLKAQNQYKAAAASESRARTMARKDENLFEDGDDASPPVVQQEPPQQLQESDAGGSEANGLSPVYRPLERDGKDDAHSMKWGM